MVTNWSKYDATGSIPSFSISFHSYGIFFSFPICLFIVVVVIVHVWLCFVFLQVVIYIIFILLASSYLLLLSAEQGSAICVFLVLVNDFVT